MDRPPSFLLTPWVMSPSGPSRDLQRNCGPPTPQAAWPPRNSYGASPLTVRSGRRIRPIFAAPSGLGAAGIGDSAIRRLKNLPVRGVWGWGAGALVALAHRAKSMSIGLRSGIQALAHLS